MDRRTRSSRALPAAVLLAAAVSPTAAQDPADAAATRTRVATTAAVVPQPPPLPQAIASFGACRAGEHVYVYGGHVGRRHAHSRANAVGAFLRLALGSGEPGRHEWEELPAGPALQGTALVAAPDGTVVRVGGMAARNEPDDEPDLHSSASVARFDPRTRAWCELTPLPEPRSSHDAVVLAGRLYVVGGWRLAGGGDGTFHTTAWVADLRTEPLVWQPLPAPRPRRAVALAAAGGRLALLGGLGPDGMLARVEVLDAERGTWSEAPPLPGSAFGTAALGDGGELLATVADGRLLAWDGGAAWRTVAQLEVPRFFHRLVAAGDGGLLVLGGAARGGHLRACELLAPAAQPVVRERTIDAPGRVAYRQALVLHGDVLWAFGGNRGGADRFAAGQLADDVWRIDLGAMTATRAGSLAGGGQSMAAASWNDRDGTVLAGGVAVLADGSVGSAGAAWRWDARARRLTPFAPLPEPRTQHELVHHDGTLYALGGVDFRPDEGGGSARGDASAVFTCDLRAAEPAFTVSGLRLPRPRRSFGAAVLGERLVLLGGLGAGFEPAGPADVLDLASRTWSELALPSPWVSPQVARIGARLYVACGGTMKGTRFTEDRSLWSWSAAAGWQRVLDELPFAVRHVQMLAWRNRLLFVANEAASGAANARVVLRTLEPDPSVHVPADAIHR